MSDGVFVKTYSAPPVDRREALRYAGYRGEADERTAAALEECISEVSEQATCRVCYTVMDTERALTFFGTESALVKKRLSDAEKVVLFAATVGLGIDKLILRYESLSPVKALLLQALGAERIESLCDEFCADIAKETGMCAGARFSPGYGDFPLEKQKEIFALLDCSRKIGLTLNGSLLMTPTKSVTALLPLGGGAGKRGCAACDKIDCDLRRNGTVKGKTI